MLQVRFQVAAVSVLSFLFLDIFFFIFFFLPPQEFERTAAVVALIRVVYLRLLEKIVFLCYYHW